MTRSRPIDTKLVADLLKSASAEQDLRGYFGTPLRSGRRFERLGGGGDRAEVANWFTAEDIVAVSLLSVSVPGNAAIELLERRSWSLNDQLASIPADVEFIDGRELLIDGGPGDALWRSLESIPGIGWVTAGKFLARKRPRLIPVYDDLVRTRLGRSTGESFWLPLHDALNADDRLLWHRLEELRERSGVGDDISLLRVLDVVTWVDERRRRGT